MRRPSMKTRRLVLAGPVDQFLFSASNILLTLQVAADDNVDRGAAVSVWLVVGFGVSLALKGALAESHAIAVARAPQLASQRISRLLWASSAVSCLAVVPALLLYSSPSLPLAIALSIPLQTFQQTWRAARQVPEGNLRVVANDAFWLLGQVAATIGFHILSPLDRVESAVAGWLVGLVLAVLHIVVEEFNKQSGAARSTSKDTRHDSILYGLESALAFAGPQLTLGVAAFALTAVEFTSLRTATVLLGPIALLAAGFRQIGVVHFAQVSSQTDSWRRFSTIGLLTGITLSAGLALSWLVFANLAGELGPVFDTPLSFAGLLMILGVSRAIALATVPLTSIARSRSPASKFATARVVQSAATFALVGLLSPVGVMAVAGGQSVANVLGFGIQRNLVEPSGRRRNI